MRQECIVSGPPWLQQSSSNNAQSFSMTAYEAAVSCDILGSRRHAQLHLQLKRGGRVAYLVFLWKSTNVILERVCNPSVACPYIPLGQQQQFRH